MLNKKDLVGRARHRQEDRRRTREALAFLAYAPVMVTSAVTRAGVTGIVDRGGARVRARRRSACRRARSTSCSQTIVAKQPPPAGPGGRHVRLYYATQASVRPPTFFVSTNHAADIGHSYRRFLINQLRKAYGFEGTPVRLVFRAHARRSAAARPPAA